MESETYKTSKSHMFAIVGRHHDLCIVPMSTCYGGGHMVNNNNIDLKEWNKLSKDEPVVYHLDIRCGRQISYNQIQNNKNVYLCWLFINLNLDAREFNVRYITFHFSDNEFILFYFPKKQKIKMFLKHWIKYFSFMPKTWPAINHYIDIHLEV